MQFSKFHEWCQANKRISMPPDEETICIYFSMLAVKSLSPHLILAARSAIRFFQHLSFPTLKPFTDSPRVQALIIGIKKKFGKTENCRLALTLDWMNILLMKCLEPDLELLNTTPL